MLLPTLATLLSFTASAAAAALEKRGFAFNAPHYSLYLNGASSPPHWHSRLPGGCSHLPSLRPAMGAEIKSCTGAATPCPPSANATDEFSYDSWPGPDKIQPYNRVLMAFWQTNGAQAVSGRSEAGGLVADQELSDLYRLRKLCAP